MDEDKDDGDDDHDTGGNGGQIQRATGGGEPASVESPGSVRIDGPSDGGRWSLLGDGPSDGGRWSLLGDGPNEGGHGSLLGDGPRGGGSWSLTGGFNNPYGLLVDHPNRDAGGWQELSEAFGYIEEPYHTTEKVFDRISKVLPELEGAESAAKFFGAASKTSSILEIGADFVGNVRDANAYMPDASWQKRDGYAIVRTALNWLDKKMGTRDAY